MWLNLSVFGRILYWPSLLLPHYQHFLELFNENPT